MRPVLSERFVTCSERTVLECRCGEKLILLGRNVDWRKEGRTLFECGGCGEKLSRRYL
jgi:predicted SprT family Zn-dependent metalloprotease